ncbi:SH3 domain-containing protein [Vibrio vulnificus]|uniref:SH3 domain-containing protein n=1 Tax=Vibrio vulnificus TaxID=672 RepID=UPI0019D47390|nr:SH3 domain-containing protein [Vibrio vulnificus]MBN8090881.1 SH3 domain-containing protein [Vibrio vulnificus]MBN8119555.1 SH3 domain-containing protein [Vibrio vulnificus]
MDIQKVIDAQAKINRVFSRQRKLTETFEKINRINTSYQKLTERLTNLDRILEHQKRVNAVLKRNTQFSKWLTQHKNAISKFEHISNRLNSDFIYNLSDDAISYVLSNPNLEQSLEDTYIELDDDSIEESIRELEVVSLSSDEAQFQSWYDNLKPSSQLLISLFLSYWLAIFANLTTPIYEDWAHVFKTETPRSAGKLIVEEATELYSLSSLKDYRFVMVTTSLHVRTEANMNSEILDDLGNGKVVHFLSKSKRWAQVQYLCSDSGEEKTGWVLARYLKKFEK